MTKTERDRESRRRWRDRNRDKIRESNRTYAQNMTDEQKARKKENLKRWKEDNRDRVRVLNERWVAANPDKVKDIYLRREYGISLEQYRLMIEGQGGLCAICRKFPETSKGFCVDHDHVTGRVRALLCSHCNVMVGMSRERPEHLLAAHDYLVKYHGIS